jgi:DNA-binding transcriptional regulator YhcF (GntR family)
MTARKTVPAPGKAFFNPFPKYLQVRQVLERRMAAEYELGQQIPTEQALCKEFGVSRETVREALRGLEEDGIVERHRPQGTFLVRRPDRPVTEKLTGLIEDFTALKLDTHARLLGVGAGWIQLTDWGSLDRALLQAWHLSRALPNQLEKRYADRLSKLSSTEREATVRQRIGQDLFREGLLTLWQGQCAISGLKVPELLRASHAKPWAASTDAERLDVFNGILLAAHLDAAFDCGMIAIDAAGVVETRSDLSLEVTRILGVNSATRVAISDQHKPYFAWHRKNIFGRG